MYHVVKPISDASACLMSMSDVSRGLAFIEQDQLQTIQDQKSMVVIDAPTFLEAQRALDYVERLRALGLATGIATEGDIIF